MGNVTDTDRLAKICIITVAAMASFIGKTSRHSSREAALLVFVTLYSIRYIV